MTAAWRPPLFGNGLDRGALWAAVLAGQDRPIAGEGWPAALRYAIAAAPGADEWCAKIAVGGLSTPLLALVRDFPFRSLFEVDLAMADLGALPDGLRGAVEDGVRATVLSLLPPGVAGRIEIVEEGPLRIVAPAPPSDTEWMILRLEQPEGLVVDLVVGWSRERIAALAARHVLAGGEAAAPLGEHLLVPAHVTLGAITLSVSDAGALEPGDVVVLAEGGGEALTVRVGELVFVFTDLGEGLSCSGPQPLDRYRPRAVRYEGKGTGMDDETTSPPGEGDRAGEAGERATTLGDLRIALDFDLGRSMVPLATVASWQEGHIIELELPTLSDGVEVTIRANGDVVGHGDLVRIDDRLAVRITRLALRA